MTQKCLKCGAPISGFLSKIAWFAGVKPSKVKSGYCNKCEREAPDVDEAQQTKAGWAGGQLDPTQPLFPDQGNGAAKSNVYPTPIPEPLSPKLTPDPIESPKPMEAPVDPFDAVGK